jgi:hypothetical protein
MKSWQEVALDVAIVAAATVLTATKVLSGEAFLLLIGPLVGAHVAKRGKGRGRDDSLPPGSASAVIALALGAAALLGRGKT